MSHHGKTIPKMIDTYSNNDRDYQEDIQPTNDRTDSHNEDENDYDDSSCVHRDDDDSNSSSSAAILRMIENISPSTAASSSASSYNRRDVEIEESRSFHNEFSGRTAVTQSSWKRTECADDDDEDETGNDRKTGSIKSPICGKKNGLNLNYSVVIPDEAVVSKSSSSEANEKLESLQDRIDETNKKRMHPLNMRSDPRSISHRVENLAEEANPMKRGDDRITNDHVPLNDANHEIKKGDVVSDQLQNAHDTGKPGTARSAIFDGNSEYPTMKASTSKAEEENGQIVQNEDASGSRNPNENNCIAVVDRDKHFQLSIREDTDMKRRIIQRESTNTVLKQEHGGDKQIGLARDDKEAELRLCCLEEIPEKPQTTDAMRSHSSNCQRDAYEEISIDTTECLGNAKASADLGIGERNTIKYHAINHTATVPHSKNRDAVTVLGTNLIQILDAERTQSPRANGSPLFNARSMQKSVAECEEGALTLSVDKKGDNRQPFEETSPSISLTSDGRDCRDNSNSSSMRTLVEYCCSVSAIEAKSSPDAGTCDNITVPDNADEVAGADVLKNASRGAAVKGSEWKTWNEKKFSTDTASKIGTTGAKLPFTRNSDVQENRTIHQQTAPGNNRVRSNVESFSETKMFPGDESAGDDDVVDQWREAIDRRTGRIYYYNRRTREAKWKAPPNAIILPRKTRVKQKKGNDETSFRDKEKNSWLKRAVDERQIWRASALEKGQREYSERFMEDTQSTQEETVIYSTDDKSIKSRTRDIDTKLLDSLMSQSSTKILQKKSKAWTTYAAESKNPGSSSARLSMKPNIDYETENSAQETSRLSTLTSSVFLEPHDIGDPQANITDVNDSSHCIQIEANRERDAIDTPEESRKSAENDNTQKPIGNGRFGTLREKPTPFHSLPRRLVGENSKQSNATCSTVPDDDKENKPNGTNVAEDMYTFCRSSPQDTSQALFCMYCGTKCLYPEKFSVHMRNCEVGTTFVRSQPEAQKQIESIVLKTWARAGRGVLTTPKVYRNDVKQVPFSTPAHEIVKNPGMFDIRKGHAAGSCYDDAKHEVSVGHKGMALHSHRGDDKQNDSVKSDSTGPWNDTQAADEMELWSYNSGSQLSGRNQEDFVKEAVISPYISSCAFCNKGFEKGDKLSAHLLVCRRRKASRRKILGSDNYSSATIPDSTSPWNGKNSTPQKERMKKMQLLLVEGGRHLPGHPKLNSSGNSTEKSGTSVNGITPKRSERR